MKWLQGLLVIVMVMAVGCSSELEQCPDGSFVSSLEECPDNNEFNTSVGEQAEVEYSESADELIVNNSTVNNTLENETDRYSKEIRKNAIDRISSFEFVYSGPGSNKGNEYFYQDGVLVVQLLEPTRDGLDRRYTHVYMYANESKAVAYCELRDSPACSFGRVGELDYGMHHVLTPLDWVMSLSRSEYLGSGPMVDRKQTDIVEFNAGNSTGIMKLARFYSVPLEVSLENGTTMKYTNIEFNSVDYRDITPLQYKDYYKNR